MLEEYEDDITDWYMENKKDDLMNWLCKQRVLKNLDQGISNNFQTILVAIATYEL